MSRVNAAVGRARGFMQGFTPGQRSVVVVVGLALVLGAFAVSRWLGQPSYTVLFGNLSGEDASAVTEALTTNGVDYQLSDGGSTVLVPAEQADEQRIALSGEGLPTGEGGAGGWSLLDKQGITATDFQQNIAYQRALEGEMAKTLQAMDGVNTAVVHLAIPQKDVFADEDQKPTASVLLSLAPGTDLGNDQVDSITHLVGGSVPDLDPTKVTVTDQSGKMLSGAGGSGATGGGANAANATDQQTAAFESRMDDKVQQVLDTVVGAGHSTVRTNAQLDFNATESTSENYTQPTPTPQPLSEASVEEQYSGGAGGTANGGTLGQIIPSPATGGGANGSGGYSRNQRTVNNSVDKTVSKTTSSPGQVKRLTVAVVLDAKTAGALDPNRVQQLVANAVGLDPTRGDSVQVDTLPFDKQAEAAAKAEIAAADKAAKTAQYLDLAKKVGLGLLILIIAFLLLRRGKNKNDDAQIEATASDLPGGVLMASTPMALEQGEQLALTGSATRDKMRDDVAALVDNQPEDVAQMLQGWLAERK
jgi:flagellar M-ring protein FliF